MPQGKRTPHKGILVREETYKRLQSRGKFGDSFDSLIADLLDLTDYAPKKTNGGQK